MSAYGIAGFVDGLVAGRDIRNRWDDRKLDRARQDKLDAITLAREAREADAYRRQTDDQDYYRRAAAEAYAASQDAAAPPPAALPAATISTQGVAAAPQPSLGFGLPPAQIPGVARIPGQTAAPQGMPPVQGSGGLSFGLPGMPDPNPAPQVPGAMIPPQAALPGHVEHAIATDPIIQKADAVLRGDAGWVQPAVKRHWQQQRDARVAAIMADPALDRTPLRGAQQSWQQGQRPALGLPPAGTDPSSLPVAPQTTIVTAPGAAPQGQPPAGPAGPAAPGSPALSFSKPRVAPGTPPQARAMAATATSAMQSANTPAIAATAESAARGLPRGGIGPGASDETRAKYAKGFMDHYIKVGAPMVVEAMLKRGDFDKAVKFQEYIDSEKTRAGMDNWARAAFAASIGDMDTFASEILTAYNRLDYFPDGTTIVKEKSGLTKDRDGNPTGAVITFRDEKTGNTWEQVLTDPNDLVRMGITMLAPEQAFEYFWQQEKQRAEAALGLASEAKKDRAALDKRIDDAAKLIFESSVGLDGKPAISLAEARMQARAAIMGEGETEAGPVETAAPPVAYRPGA